MKNDIFLQNKKLDAIAGEVDSINNSLVSFQEEMHQSMRELRTSLQSALLELKEKRSSGQEQTKGLIQEEHHRAGPRIRIYREVDDTPNLQIIKEEGE